MSKEYLKDLKLNKDEYGYYLTAVYIEENDKGIYEHTVPHIDLPISNYPSIETTFGDYIRPEQLIDIGFGKLNMGKDERGRASVTRTIKEKVHDLTIGEIEKKLGYKVRIVSE